MLCLSVLATEQKLNKQVEETQLLKILEIDNLYSKRVAEVLRRTKNGIRTIDKQTQNHNHQLTQKTPLNRQLFVLEPEELAEVRAMYSIAKLHPSLTFDLLKLIPRALCPRTTNKHTLALDLDETLVHAMISKSNSHVKVQYRPNLATFLSFVYQWYEVVVFTTAEPIYANAVMKEIDPEKRIKVVSRGSCARYNGKFTKLLHVLNRPLESVFLIDNQPFNFAFQMDNGIPIKSWSGEKTDSELMNLLPFLHKLKDTEDVRPYIRRVFGIKAFL